MKFNHNFVKSIQTKIYNSPTAVAENDETLIDTKVPDKFSSSFLSLLLERGFIHQCTDFKGLDEKFSNVNKPVLAYLGFDATAKSLHVGSLLQIMILRHLQKTGHKPIILIGGGTTKVGDPTGTYIYIYYRNIMLQNKYQNLVLILNTNMIFIPHF